MCSNSHGSDAIVPSLLFCDEASDNVQFDDDIVKEVMTTTSNPSLMKCFFFFYENPIGAVASYRIVLRFCSSCINTLAETLLRQKNEA